MRKNRRKPMPVRRKSAAPKPPLPRPPVPAREPDITEAARALPLPDFPTPDGWEGDPNEQVARLLGKDKGVERTDRDAPPPQRIDWDAEPEPARVASEPKPAKGHVPASRPATARRETPADLPEYPGIQNSGFESLDMTPEEAAAAAKLPYGKFVFPQPPSDPSARRRHMEQAREVLNQQERDSGRRENDAKLADRPARNKRDDRKEPEAAPESPPPAPQPPAQPAPPKPQAERRQPTAAREDPAQQPPALPDLIASGRTEKQRRGMASDAAAAMRAGLSEREVSAAFEATGGEKKSRRRALDDALAARRAGASEEDVAKAIEDSGGDTRKRREGLEKAVRKEEGRSDERRQQQQQQQQQRQQEPPKQELREGGSRPGDDRKDNQSAKLDEIVAKLSEIVGLLSAFPAALDAKLRLG